MHVCMHVSGSDWCKWELWTTRVLSS